MADNFILIIFFYKFLNQYFAFFFNYCFKNNHLSQNRPLCTGEAAKLMYTWRDILGQVGFSEVECKMWGGFCKIMLKY